MTDPLYGQRLVILGLARQGTALARFAAGAGATVVVSDLRAAAELGEPLAALDGVEVTLVLGEHPARLLDGADVLAISGGVPADAPLVTAARARGIAITNDSLEFIRRCPVPVVGITGSAGKSTTTALVGALGRAAGRPTWVGGNIGRPLIGDLAHIGPDDLVVQELSSFQLEIWTRSPAIALITNITPNHLDRHRTMAAYTAAKANILAFQTAADTAILPWGELPALAETVRGRRRYFSDGAPVPDGAFLRDGAVVLRDGARETVVCTTADIQLRGAHNVKNVLAAVVAADSAGVPPAAMRAGIRGFAGIEHRLEPVATVDGVTWVNDSIATAPERALAALASFDEPIVLLAGGRDKAMAWEAWAETVAARVKQTILFGSLAPALAARLDAAGGAYTIVETMADAIEQAQRLAAPGDVVLLSPGGTSFDAYPDFAARGRAFRAQVLATVGAAARNGVLEEG